MRQDKLLEHLGYSHAHVTPDNISANPNLYQNLVEILEKLEPGQKDTYPYRDALRLATSGEEWASVSPAEFLQACEENPETALKHAAETWADLNPDRFLQNCHNDPELALDACPQTWYDLEPVGFTDAWEQADILPKNAASNVYAKAKPETFIAICRRLPNLALRLDAWAKLDPETYAQICDDRRHEVFRYYGETAKLWREADPEGFWASLAERCGQEPTRTHKTKMSEKMSLALAPEIVELILKEQPELLKDSIRTLDTGNWGEGTMQTLIDNGEKWQQVNPTDYCLTVAIFPEWSAMGIGRLGEAGRAQLLEGLEVNDMTEKPALNRLLAILSKAGPGSWDAEDLKQALIQANKNLERAVTEKEKATAIEAMRYAIQQAKQENLERLVEVLVSGRKTTEYPQVLQAVMEGTPGLYIDLFEKSTYPVDGPSTSEHTSMRNAVNMISHLRFNLDSFIQNLKETRTPLNETTQTLLELTLGQSQRNDLVRWALETPGLDNDTLQWATANAANLGVMRPAKIRKPANSKLDRGRTG